MGRIRLYYTAMRESRRDRNHEVTNESVVGECFQLTFPKTISPVGNSYIVTLTQAPLGDSEQNGVNSGILVLEIYSFYSC